MAESPCVKRVFVASRTGADVPMGKIDIPLEKVSLHYWLLSNFREC